LLVGCIVVTSIRGLLITLTKVRESCSAFWWNRFENSSQSFSFSIKYRRASHRTSSC
jgi:hypothetical protein